MESVTFTSVQFGYTMNNVEIFLLSEFGEQGHYSLKDGLTIIFYSYVTDITQNYIPINTTISEYIKENYAIFIRII